MGLGLGLGSGSGRGFDVPLAHEAQVRRGACEGGLLLVRAAHAAAHCDVEAGQGLA